MRVFRDYRDITPDMHGAAMAIGNFDGVHLGHQAVLGEARSTASTHNVPCMVMTFTPHPRHFFSRETTPFAIDPLHIRLRRLKAFGVEAILLQRFNTNFAKLSADAFIEHVLVDSANVSHVTVGENFHFGKGRTGDINLLQRKAVEHRFGFTYMPPVLVRDNPASSSRIRNCITEGRMQDAATLLGRPYQVYGRVIHGAKRGREMHTPTINLRLDGIHMPRFGVYAVEFAVIDSADCATHPPQWQHGVANLGIRPTFEDNNTPLLETHSFTSLDNVYGKYVRIRLIEHIRDEIAFPDQKALQQQIMQDITRAKQYLTRYQNNKTT